MYSELIFLQSFHEIAEHNKNCKTLQEINEQCTQDSILP